MHDSKYVDNFFMKKKITKKFPFNEKKADLNVCHWKILNYIIKCYRPTVNVSVFSPQEN